MISSGIFDLADVVQERGELRALTLVCVEPEAVGDTEHECDDVATVCARVLVVGFDDVAQQHRGAAIRMAELERMVDAHLALTGEELKQGDERKDDEHGPDPPARGDRHDEPHGCEGRVDEKRDADGPCVLHERDTERRSRPDCARDEVGAELCRERGEVQGDVRPGGCPAAARLRTSTGPTECQASTREK